MKKKKKKPNMSCWDWIEMNLSDVAEVDCEFTNHADHASISYSIYLIIKKNNK